MRGGSSLAANRCLFLLTDRNWTFALFVIFHLAMGIAMVVTAIAAELDGRCIYPFPPFLFVSGILMLLSAILPPAALLNVGPLIWGSFMSFESLQEFVIRMKIREEEVETAIHPVLTKETRQACDDAPFIVSLVCVVLAWSYYCYFLVVLLLDCEVGSRLYDLRNRHQDQLRENHAATKKVTFVHLDTE